MAFISEIHYRNGVSAETGVREYVEISVEPSDLDRLSDFSVVTYQSDGTVRETLNLGGMTGTLDPASGWYVFTLPTQVTDPNHTTGSNEAEAIAFVDAAATPAVQTFIDIGSGTTAIAATEGLAAGLTSQNIAPAAGQSIQFDVRGTRIDGALTPDSAVICLTGGTLITTPDGERTIDDLAIGDLVTTYDNGDQPIRMIYRRTLSGDTFRAARKLWPVCLQAGSLGFGLPRRALRVSPQHRMLYSHIRIPLMFGEDAVFVRAKSLAASFEEIYVDSTLDSITYFHLVFDRHEVIFAEGAATESFHPGPEGIANLDPDEQAELFALFPELRFGIGPFEPGFATIRSWELKAAVA